MSMIDSRGPVFAGVNVGPLAVERSSSPFQPDLIAMRGIRRVYWPDGEIAKVAGMQTVSRQLLTHAAIDVDAWVERDFDRTMDRIVRPWAYWDRPAWPTFEPFPRATRLIARMKHLREYSPM